VEKYNGVTMKVALFGGSFDPVHVEHVRFVRAAIELLGLDRVVVMPTKIAPHKQSGAHENGETRLQMCKIAFRGLPQVEVSDFELRSEGVSYSYLTCREFAKQYPDAERYFLVGADMLEDFFTWKNPSDILSNVTLAACCRGNGETESLRNRFEGTFHQSFLSLNFTGDDVSSTRVRVELAFGKRPQTLDGEVYRYIREHHVYEYPMITPALALEKAERREHSFRVALMACERARSLRIEERKALLAAALHDAAKYVPTDSPLLAGFEAPHNVPNAVLHQYSGAYLAEHIFGIDEEDILNAIRFHTSGRKDMGTLEKLIFLSDMLESARNFPDVDMLREAFWKDLDECLCLCLNHQIRYLQGMGADIYPLTEEAYRWICEERSKN